MYQLVVPGKPNGKQRPRLGRGGHIYSPEDVDGFASKIQVVARMEHVECTTNPVAFDMLVLRAMPKSWSKTKRAAMENEAAIGKPDIDNVLKSAMDALTGIAWEDDTQVTHVAMRRLWSQRDEVVLGISEL